MNTYFIYSIIGVILGATGSSAADLPPYRLDGKVEPRHYDLVINTGLETDEFKFWGSALIEIACIEETDRIAVHSHNLVIDESHVTLTQALNPENLKKFNIASHSYDKENEYYIAQTDSKLQAGQNYSLFIPFSGVMPDDLAGFYRSSYTDSKTNETKWLGVTQFESTDARKAFPCFDEPKMKATFTITIGHPEKYTSLSNMPLEETIPMPNKPGWVQDKFQKSVPMSTYLVAWMVSDFTHKEATMTEGGVTFRVWAREEAVNQTDFANQFGPKVLSYYEEYFDTKYPLPKQDMAAIPDFSAGAMENWGLITYREVLLLFDPKASSSLNQERIASVIAHELAHQWFGNLVTMEWWTDLWLNEGFATYVATIGLHHLFPEWNSLQHDTVNNLNTVFTLDALKSSHPVSVPIGNPKEIAQIFDTISYRKGTVSSLSKLNPEWNSLVHEVTENMLAVFRLDSLQSSHPVSVPIGHPNEIAQIFDNISYEKGSCIIRMMNQFLGEDVFRAGVTLYLSKHKFGNARQDDLWAALTEIAHERGVLDPDVTVKMIMDTWTVQTGYPVLSVVRNYETGDISVSQRRYLGIEPSAEERSLQEACWRVPLSYTYQEIADFSETKPEKWLTCEGPLNISTFGASEDQWIIFNIQVSGLYRINYDLKNWNLLAGALNDESSFKKIHPLNRMQLIADAMDLAWMGDLEYKTAFSVCRYLSHETEYVPWSSAASALGQIDTMLRRTANYGYFKNYIRELVSSAFKRSGPLTETPKGFEAIKMKNLVTGLADKYEIGDFKDQALQLFKKWYNHKNSDTVNPIPKDIRGRIYCTAIKNGGDEEWAFLWARYLKSNLATEKSTILSALGCSRKVWLLNRYLEWSIDKTSGIRSQDAASVFSSVAYNEVGFSLAKEFFAQRVADIFAYHGAKNSRMGSYVKVLANQMISRAEYDEMKELTQKHEEYLKFSGLSVKQALESIDINARWHSKHYAAIPDYLSPSL